MGSTQDKRDILPDDYLREIGRVAVEWSKVEGAVEAIIWTYLFVDFETTSPWLREIDGRAITTHVNILLRIDMMLSLDSAEASTKLFYSQIIRDDVAEIARLVRDIAPKRNKVLHSLWSPIGKMALRQSYRARGDVSPFYDVMSLDDVKRVADDAAALYDKINAFTPRLCEVLQEQRATRFQREQLERIHRNHP